MTTVTLNIKDESKADDVLRFLGDIPFLEIIPQENQATVQTPIQSSPSERIPTHVGLDFSKYSVDSFLERDPLKYQQDMRNEWK